MISSPHERRQHPAQFALLTESATHLFCVVQLLMVLSASRVCLYPGFVDLREADWVLEQLCQEVPWKQRTGIREGKWISEIAAHPPASLSEVFSNTVASFLHNYPKQTFEIDIRSLPGLKDVQKLAKGKGTEE